MEVKEMVRIWCPNGFKCKKECNPERCKKVFICLRIVKDLGLRK